MATKRSSSPAITRVEARAALLRSGYLLESRIESVLDDRRYFVEANTTYPDPITQKSRELDLLAISARQMGKETDFLFLCLLIECVNNPQPIAFITKEPQVGFLFHNEFRVSGLPVKILGNVEEESWQQMTDYLNVEEYHHYSKGRVATQFCSFQKKGGSAEWMALHKDEHFDSFRKLSDALDYEVDKHFSDWVFDESEEKVNLQFYYPIVVVQGELLDVRPTKRSVRIQRSQHVQFRRSSIVDGEERDYQIDVVTEAYFPKYLDLIEEEKEKMARRLIRRRERVTQSLNAIVEQARNEADSDKRRAIMDY